MTHAVIFDMDGVLVDSERFWRTEADAIFLKAAPQLTTQQLDGFVGRPIFDIYQTLIDEHGARMPFERYRALFETAAQSIYLEKSSLAPGTEKMLKQLRAQNLRLALASSSPSGWVALFLKRWHLAKYFDAVLGGEAFKGKGKPAPDIYLEAAKRLGVPPDVCVGVEDSTNGIRAVKAASMRCIGFLNGYGRNHDLSKADVITEDLSKIPSIISTF